MKIAIIGTGYVGLTTGVCFAELGHEIICVDIDEKKIEMLNGGKVPIYEPGLEELLEKNGVKFTTDAIRAIQDAEVVISAVGTPMGESYEADLRYVKEVAKTFGLHANNKKVFVNKSTVPVGTADICKAIIQQEFAKREVNFGFEIVSNPEFLREGTAIKDTLFPDRIVVGTETESARQIMGKMYEKIPGEKLFTDIKSAEIIKYAANSFLATKISYINEIANFTERAGGNIKDIAKGIGLDSRIGEKFLNAGIGYGGSCLPKDVKAFVQKAKEFGYDFEIIKSAESVNEKQKLSLLARLRLELGPLEGKKIAIWGLAFKPETDDMRSAPSLVIIKKLQAEGAIIQTFDPQATENAKKIIEPFNITFHEDKYEATANTDALLILTEWPEFAQADTSKIASPIILDGRNILQTIDKKIIKIGDPVHDKSPLHDQIVQEASA